MAHLPSLERFVELAQGADFVPVYRELLSDASLPVQAFRRLDRGPGRRSLRKRHRRRKGRRYSFVASDPFYSSKPAAQVKITLPPDSVGGKELMEI